MLNFADVVPAYGFRKLFSDAILLAACPELPAKTIGDYGCAGIFEHCTGLTNPIAVIPALNLGRNCLDSMYAGCSSLTSMSKLKATVMAPYCCNVMYYLTGLTSAEIPEVTLAEYCFRNMFYSCLSLKQISVNFTSWSNATEGWVTIVPSGGTFIKPAALPEKYGYGKIPTGWTVVNK